MIDITRMLAESRRCDVKVQKTHHASVVEMLG